MVRGFFSFDQNVISKIRAYLDANEFLQKYEICCVMQYEHPDDRYLYKVLARDTKDDTYTYWSIWNDKTESLGYGHYDLPREVAYTSFLER